MADFITFTNDGIITELDAWTSAWLNNGTLRLYKNNVEPGHTATPASFVEATFTGYSAIDGLTFSPAYVNFVGQIQSDCPPQRFNFTAGVGSATCFGWYITDAGGSRCLCFSSFNIPATLDNENDKVFVFPSILINSQV